MSKYPNRHYLSTVYANHRRKTNFVSLRRKAAQAATKPPSWRYWSFIPTQAAAEQSGNRQRREKALPFLKEEKSEHERARSYEIAIQLRRARHCELPLSKVGSKGLFPGG